MTNNQTSSAVIPTLMIIGYVWPEPRSSAAGTRMLQLISTFKDDGWQVIFSSPAQPTEHMTCLADIGVESRKINLNCSSFDDYIQTINPTAVMFDRFMMEEQFAWRVEKYCPQALRILDTEDLHFLRDARHKAVKQQHEEDEQTITSDLALRELSAIYRCDITLIISKVEMALLIEKYNIPANILHYIPIYAEPCAQQQADYRERQDFVFIGNFRHAPNWDAVLYLKQQIWPQIRQQLPKATLNIYGAYPPPKATQLHNEKQGFLVKGWADSAQQVIADAKVMLAPVRFGAGLKGKLLEAMQWGTPSITSTKGAEGIANSDQWPGVVTDSVQEFATAAVNLHNDKQRWQQAQLAGSRCLAEQFSKQQHAPQLIERVNVLLTRTTAHRQDNLIGLMLRHHSHKSTQYMAQWIAAKNS